MYPSPTERSKSNPIVTMRLTSASNIFFMSSFVFSSESSPSNPLLSLIAFRNSLRMSIGYSICSVSFPASRSAAGA